MPRAASPKKTSSFAARPVWESAPITAAFCGPGETLLGWIALGTPAKKPGGPSRKGGVETALQRTRLESLGVTVMLGAKAQVVRVTAAGLRESHVHDVIITKEAPNYRVDAY